MRAEIVSIGTELLLGTITDTNAAYLAQRLAALGIDCYYVSQVGDNLGRLVETLKRGWERSDLIVTTGGLGPTGDDLTREAISALLGERMEVVPSLEADLRAFFTRRGLEMPETNLKQASLIPSSQPLPNPIGTAPGWWVTRDNVDGQHIIVSMPGVPYEMRRMWENEVEPRLRQRSSTVIVSRTLKVLGMGESAVEDKVKDLMVGANPTLAPYAKPDGIHLRITAKAHDGESAQPLIANLEEAVRARLGDLIYGIDDDTPQSVAVGMLIDAGYTCALLEVGGSVVGALAPMLWYEGMGPVVGSVAVGDLAELSRIVRDDDARAVDESLQDGVERIRAHLGTDVALAVKAEALPMESGGRTVSADIEILLIAPDESGQPHLTRVRQTWRTDVLEVKRLAGLAAINLLRLRLLKNRKHDS